MEQNQKECQQCGTCCTSGGPALHKEDKHLVVDGDLPLSNWEESNARPLEWLFS